MWARRDLTLQVMTFTETFLRLNLTKENTESQKKTIAETTTTTTKPCSIIWDRL